MLGPAAHAVEWEFKPMRVGLVLPGSGWAVDRPLASVNISQEFSFPLQLVYLSVRSEKGLFGDQWFCPQLESTVLPRGKNILVWTTPSGNIVGLFTDKGRANVFADREHGFEARVSGELTTISDNDGWQYIYRHGRLATVQAPSGRQLEYSTSSNSLWQVTYRDKVSGASRIIVTISRKGNGLAEEIGVNGTRIQFGYQKPPDERLMSITRPGVENPETIEYSRDGVLSVIKPPAGIPATFKTQFFQPEEPNGGNALPAGKTANSRLIDDGSFSYFYDNKNGLVKATDRIGGWQSYQYSEKRGVEISATSAGEEIVKYYFRAPGRKHNGKLRRIEKNGKVVVESFYDKKTGNLIESRDGAGISTFFEYPEAVRREANISAGVSTKADDSLCRKPIRILRGNRDKQELVEALQYDELGRVITRTATDDRVTRYTYNARGELESVTDPEGVRTTFNRDSFGRPTSVVKGEQREVFDFDEYGRIKSKTTPDGQVAEFSYDDAGRPSAVKQNGVPVATNKYDKNGVLVAKTDALGRATSIERDAKGHVTAENQPNGTVTRYEYDEAGHRTAQIDGNGNRITFKYDPSGRLVEQRNLLGQVLTWNYDPDGKLVGRSNGVQKITQSYDENNRLKKVDYGVKGEKVVYTYDSKGRTKRVATPTNSIVFYYDPCDRVIARQLTRGAVKRVVRYGWDALGRKTSVTLSQKIPFPAEAEKQDKASKPTYQLLQQTEYVYDAKGRLQDIKSNGTSVCRYQYDGKGRLIGRQYGNGITASYVYDSFGRQARLEHSRAVHSRGRSCLPTNGTTPGNS